MDQPTPDEPPFESHLTSGTDRFIAHMIEHAFATGRRTSRDFLRHFPPAAIMEALKDSPTLRADILETSTGVRRKIALKKSAESSGEDLQIALSEGVAAPDEVIRLFRPDDRVRYLQRDKLWVFLIEGEFWKASKSDKANYDRAQQHIAFLLDRSLKDQLLSHQDIVEGISISRIAALMPRQELEVALESALSAGRQGQAFSDRNLYESLTSATLTTHIPLPHIWDEVIHPCVAVEHGLAEKQDSGEAAAAGQEPAASGAESAPVPDNSNDAASALGAGSSTGSARVSRPSIGSTKKPRQNDLPAPNVTGKLPVPTKPPAVIEHAVLQDDVAFDLDLDDTITASKG